MSAELPLATKQRIAYAFRAFCAIYGYDSMVECESTPCSTDARICYGVTPSSAQDLSIPAVYAFRPANVPAPPPVPLTPPRPLPPVQAPIRQLDRRSAAGSIVNPLEGPGVTRLQATKRPHEHGVHTPLRTCQTVAVELATTVVGGGRKG